MASEPENEAHEPAPTEAPPAAADAPKERLDDEGLPLDRPPTLDDVRGADGGGRLIAIGCTGLVILVVLGFWALRGFLAH